MSSLNCSYNRFSQESRKAQNEPIYPGSTVSRLAKHYKVSHNTIKCEHMLEVRDAFNLHILAAFIERGDERTGQFRLDLIDALNAGDLQKMLEKMRAFFASIPFNLQLDKEAYYHSIFYTLMSTLGFDMDIEVAVSMGRLDAVLELSDKVYVMEFKYKQCPQKASAEKKRKLFDEALDEAMCQINDRGYADKYSGSGKTIIKAAFAFLGRGEIELRVERTESAY